MQIDASDEYWSAILLEDLNGQKHVYGYKSGHFKPSKLNYHSTFKEILAIKRGIEKFKFHLSDHHFIVETDMTSFPSMLVPKSKRLPHPQLVRWNEWFANYFFTVKHVKGKDNIVPDYLSRPSYKKLSKPITLYSHPFHIYTMSSTNPLPPGIADLPPEFPSLFSTLPIDETDTFKNLLLSYQNQAI